MILVEERRWFQSHRGDRIPGPKTEVSDLFLLESSETDVSIFLKLPPGRYLTQRVGKPRLTVQKGRTVHRGYHGQC